MMRAMILRTEGLTQDVRGGGPRAAASRRSRTSRSPSSEGEIFGFVGPNGAGQDHHHQDADGAHPPDRGPRLHLRRAHPHRRRRRRASATSPSTPPTTSSSPARRRCGSSRPSPACRVAAQADALRASCSSWSGSRDAADRQIRKYSKGMQQRLGIAQALVDDPAFVVLDEPMSGLDPVGRKEVRDLILELKRRGKTVFFSTHILPDVEALCDRVGRHPAAGGSATWAASGDLLSPRVRSVELDRRLAPGARAALAAGSVLAREGERSRSPSRTRRQADAAVAAVLAAGGRVVALTAAPRDARGLLPAPAGGGSAPSAERRRTRPGGSAERAAAELEALPARLGWWRRRCSAPSSAASSTSSSPGVPGGRVDRHAALRAARAAGAPIALVRQRPGPLLAGAAGALPPLRRSPSRSRYPRVELLGARRGAWRRLARHGLSARRRSPSSPSSRSLLALAFIDLDTWLLPHVLTWPLLAARARRQRRSALAPAAVAARVRLRRGLGFAVFAARRAPSASSSTKKEALGFGDVWLLAGLGAWLGAAALLPVVLLASVQGSVVGSCSSRSGGASPARKRPRRGGLGRRRSAARRGRRATGEGPARSGRRAIAAEEEDWVPPRHAVPFGPFLVAGALEWLYLGGSSPTSSPRWTSSGWIRPCAPAAPAPAPARRRRGRRRPAPRVRARRRPAPRGARRRSARRGRAPRGRGGGGRGRGRGRGAPPVALRGAPGGPAPRRRGTPRRRAPRASSRCSRRPTRERPRARPAPRSRSSALGAALGESARGSPPRWRS